MDKNNNAVWEKYSKTTHFIGRFVSADQFVQAPDNMQSLNRYSYVLNNPLSLTDPSGHFSFKKFWKKAFKFVKTAVKIGIVVGVAYGTGLYINTLVGQTFGAVQAAFVYMYNHESQAYQERIAYLKKTGYYDPTVGWPNSPYDGGHGPELLDTKPGVFLAWAHLALLDVPAYIVSEVAQFGSWLNSTLWEGVPNATVNAAYESGIGEMLPLKTTLKIMKADLALSGSAALAPHAKQFHQDLTKAKQFYFEELWK